MKFKDAYKIMRYEGKKIRIPGWNGFWVWENDTIMIYCKDGTVLDIRETTDVEYTFDFICREDWEVIDYNTNNGYHLIDTNGKIFTKGGN